LCIPFASANLVITPSAPSISTVWYTNSVFNLSVWNNDSAVTLSNLTFSPTQFFSFPQSVDLLPNESKTISYAVYTNELFTNRQFISNVAFFYSINNSPAVVSYEVNISGSGFSLIPVLMSNDSIVWHNLLNSSVTLRDLATGFPEIVIPAGGSISRTYVLVQSYSFYIVQNGIAGSFSVIPRSGTSFAHDSALDVPLSFRLSSILPASTMAVNLLTENIAVDNNGTYVEALIEVRNLDPNLVIQNVFINGSRWISGFSPNGFNLPAGGVQRVLFNITPYVDKTNLTNKTSKIILNVKSDNAGATVKDIDVFIRYQNMDVVSIGGVNYTITVLGINQTIEACLQHMNDAGFERCLDLKRFGVNTTIIKEIPASYEFTQAQVKTYADSWATLSGVAQRLENKQNLYLDRQASSNAKVDNLSDVLTAFKLYVDTRESERDRVVDKRNLRFWLLFSFGMFLFLMYLVVQLLSNIELFTKLEKAGQ
jgi:hypothetical protein